MIDFHNTPEQAMTIQRRTRKPTSYVDVDLTAESEDEVMPLKPSQRLNKRKAVSRRNQRTLANRQEVEESSSEESDVPDLGEEEYEVDYIVKSRFRQYGKKTVLEYFIHWKGYPEEERTWTLADQFDDDDPPVVAFYKKNPRAARKGQNTPFSLLMGNRSQNKPATPVKTAPAARPKPAKPTKEVKAPPPAPGKENRPVKKPRLATRSESEEFVPPDVEEDPADDDDDYDDNVASESDEPAEEDEDEDDDDPGEADTSDVS